jgi:galactokinase
MREARAPGRVNLIGDHTDYTGGLVLPMAIDRWTTVRFEPDASSCVQLVSEDDPEPAAVPLDVADPATVSPPWARYVAGVVAELQPPSGGRGTVATSVPVGAGLSSSAALEVAVALALDPSYAERPLELARVCQAAEHRASGVPTGIMDQLTSAAGVADHALLIDCHSSRLQPVPLPPEAEVVVRFVAHRTLIGSEYTDRVAECAQAELIIGPLRLAGLEDVKRIDDDVVRRRARHVVTENERVRDFAAMLAARDLERAGSIMTASHVSLRDDFGTSTPVMDAAVEELVATPGVYGARMTGGGFGGCVVALCQPDARRAGWIVRAVDGATVRER